MDGMARFVVFKHVYIWIRKQLDVLTYNKYINIFVYIHIYYTTHVYTYINIYSCNKNRHYTYTFLCHFSKTTYVVKQNFNGTKIENCI